MKPTIPYEKFEEDILKDKKNIVGCSDIREKCGTQKNGDWLKWTWEKFESVSSQIMPYRKTKIAGIHIICGKAEPTLSWEVIDLCPKRDLQVFCKRKRRRWT